MLLQLALIFSLAALGGTSCHGAKTTKHITFYLHDTITASPGHPATSVRITTGTTVVQAEPKIRFGDMFVIDDPLTEGPDPASPVLGRAQGYYLFASQEELALMLNINVVLTAGPYKGSTVAVVSRDLITDEVRELPVVGGTGAFRGVTGYGLLRTQEYNVSAMNAILKIDMYLRF